MSVGVTLLDKDKFPDERLLPPVKDVAKFAPEFEFYSSKASAVASQKQAKTVKTSMSRSDPISDDTRRRESSPAGERS